MHTCIICYNLQQIRNWTLDIDHLISQKQAYSSHWNTGKFVDLTSLALYCIYCICSFFFLIQSKTCAVCIGIHSVFVFFFFNYSPALQQSRNTELVPCLKSLGTPGPECASSNVHAPSSIPITEHKWNKPQLEARSNTNPLSNARCSPNIKQKQKKVNYW